MLSCHITGDNKGDSEPEEGFPLYLYTHGSGDKTSEWRTGINICQKFDDAPSVYFIPQIPNMGDYYRWWQKAKQFAWEKMLRLAFVSGKINPNKVYFFGISEGGYWQSTVSIILRRLFGCSRSDGRRGTSEECTC